MVATLLPENSSALEIALADAGDLKPEVISAVDALPGFKFSPPDSFIPFLIWEYGLGEILPFLDNPRLAIQEGILWQRLRGTESGLRLALSWIGMQGTATEQEGVGEHYAEFQMDSGGVPKSPEDFDALLKLTNLSIPLRSRLSRIYHGYDLRRYILDDTVLGNGLLSDYSGIRLPGFPMLSFGRSRSSHTVFPEQNINRILTRTFSSEAKYEDRLLLDYFNLGDIPVPNLGVGHSHLSVYGWGKLTPDISRKTSTFCKSEIVLSDDNETLGDTNSSLPAFYLKQEGEYPILDETDWGDEFKVIRSPIDERFDRKTKSLMNEGVEYFVQRTQHSHHVLHFFDEILNPAYPVLRNSIKGFYAESRFGEGWPMVPWIRGLWGERTGLRVGHEKVHTNTTDFNLDYTTGRTRRSLHVIPVDLSDGREIKRTRESRHAEHIEIPPPSWPELYWADPSWVDAQYLTSMNHTRSN